MQWCPSYGPMGHAKMPRKVQVLLRCFMWGTKLFSWKNRNQQWGPAVRFLRSLELLGRSEPQNFVLWSPRTTCARANKQGGGRSAAQSSKSEHFLFAACLSHPCYFGHTKDTQLTKIFYLRNSAMETRQPEHRWYCAIIGFRWIQFISLAILVQ